MSEESFIETQNDTIAASIFNVSSVMIGVCLAVIGLLNISSSIKKIGTFIDDLTAIDALTFIISCYTSYVALKTKGKKRRLFLEKLTDRIFLAGLLLMVAVCFFVVYTFNI